MDIGILPGFSLSILEKGLIAAGIIRATYEEYSHYFEGELDSEAIAALAVRSIAGASVSIDTGWAATITIGGNSVRGIDLTAPLTLSEFNNLLPSLTLEK